MLFKMTLPIRKKTDDLDMPGLTTLTRKQKGCELFLFFTHQRGNQNGKTIGADFGTECKSTVLLSESQENEREQLKTTAMKTLHALKAC